MARSRFSAKFRRIRHRIKIIKQFESHAHWRAAPIQRDTVLYESFSGNGMLCNPEAIFTELLAAPDQQHLQHVWALSDFHRYRATIQRFAGYPNVSFVRTNSAAYYRALATSKYLINNATFPPQFGKREGQIYLNTWHGTPLKKMGYDIEGGGPDTRNIVRNFVMADYLLSGSEFMTQQMYQTAYKLRGIYRGSIIQEGFPRIDRQFATPQQVREIRGQLRDRGVSIDPGQQIVLYAPTWKGSSFHRAEDDAEELLARITELNARIDTTRYRVLLKVHQQVYKYAMDRPELRGLLVPNDVPANVALAVTDVLVTDYSSIFYDFLATGRPILFHVPDLADYGDQRGLYVGTQDWPGPVTDRIDELAAMLDGLGTDDDAAVACQPRYAKAAADYVPRDDGGAARRVVDVVFRGRRQGYDVRSDLTDGRESILIYLGGMRTNGITTSMLNLLDNIDYDRFDVSALYSYRRRSEDRMKNEAKINPNVRLFPYVGGINGSKRFTLARRRLLAQGLTAPRVDLAAQNRLFAEEFRRVFGDARFDYVVDFSGYGPFWDYVFLTAPARCRSIWMHNDMAADRLREVNGRRPLEAGLGAVATTYRHFDKLVSVSPALAEINRANLGDIAGDAEFTAAVNTINHRAILAAAGADLLAELPAPEGGETGGEEGVVPDTGDDPVDEAKRQESLRQAAERRALIERIIHPAPGVTTFVTVGRCSPEKNHARLIRAFGQVHAADPATRLIIVGSGPLYHQLEELVEQLGLTESVILTGQQNNPHAILRHGDCFVLSSDYEGQPMVILEARVLGLPVVSTDFASVRGSLPDGVGLVVPRTDDGLADGMRAHLRGAVPNPRFDYEGYNAEAVQQFYQAIGAARSRPAPPRPTAAVADADGSSAPPPRLLGVPGAIRGD
ncbi:CDP-glycerol glycerophosphotransferase [Actinocatenispora thailandica]|uniref:CDP-glycerol glycerophosphotransferase n=1 Tax=Actinocatenispora thailandica TaxID=227318 RepID=A0A7R7DQY0_9ACTN|nr:glycosyltransferase [Actinocatenispora thailandica]BCJ36255.1 CDP-glycerol glycerophosphotransferase [Actinocatenispora thailandica]